MNTLYYVHDPMCSWCWGFAKTWQKLKASLPETVEVISLVGGLAPDSDIPMEADLQAYLPTIWRSIQERIPDTQFNYDFWEKCQPRRSTYPSCRAVLSAKEIDATKESAMIIGIQKAYYLNAQNPSDMDTLVDVAVSIGLDKDQFERLMVSDEIESALQQDIQLARSIGGNSFPSLFLKRAAMGLDETTPIGIDYNSAENILASINAQIS